MSTFWRRKTKWKRKGRLKGRQAEGIDGAEIIRLKPDPVLREITLAVATDGLRLLGVDVEELIAGRPVNPRPPLQRADEFMRAVVVNHTEYNMAAMPFDRAAGIVSLLAAEFFFACSEAAGRLSSGGGSRKKGAVS